MKQICKSFLIIFIGLSCSNFVGYREKVVMPKKIEISYVDFAIVTDFCVTCNIFYNSFSEEVHHYTIEDSKNINRFMELSEKLSPDSIYKQDIDTRAEIIFLYPDNHKEEMCLNGYAEEYNGIRMKPDYSFINYVKYLLK